MTRLPPNRRLSLRQQGCTVLYGDARISCEHSSASAEISDREASASLSRSGAEIL